MGQLTGLWDPLDLGFEGEGDIGCPIPYLEQVRQNFAYDPQNDTFICPEGQPRARSLGGRVRPCAFG